MFLPSASLGVEKTFKYPVRQTQASEQQVLKELCKCAWDFQGMMLNPLINKHHGIFVNTWPHGGGKDTNLSNYSFIADDTLCSS